MTSRSRGYRKPPSWITPQPRAAMMTALACVASNRRGGDVKIACMLMGVLRDNRGNPRVTPHRWQEFPVSLYGDAP